MTQEEPMAISIKEIRDRALGLNYGSSSYPSSAPTTTSTPASQRQRPYPPTGEATSATPETTAVMERQMNKSNNTFVLDKEHTLVLSSSQYFYPSLSSSSSSAASLPHSAETHSLSLLKSHQCLPGPSR
jgi:hypothetical protein